MPASPVIAAAALGHGGLVGGVLQSAPEPAGAVAVGGGDLGPGVARLLGADQARAHRQHPAPVIGLALVEPEQAVLHGHIELRGPEVDRAAELAVPGMGVLMRQQAAAAGPLAPVLEVAQAHAVLAALVVLQADAAHAAGDGQQKVVMLEMPGGEQAVGLDHQVLVRLDLRFAGLQLGRVISHEVEHHGLGMAGRVQLDAAAVGAGEQGRIGQGVQADRLEAQAIEAGGCWARAAVHAQGAGLGPAGRQGHLGLHLDGAGVVAGRVEQHADPLQVQHLGRHHHPAAFALHRAQELEGQVQLAHTSRHLDMKSKGVHRVAQPGQFLRAGLDLEAGQAVHRAVGAMGTGQVTRKQQGQAPGLHGQLLAHLENVAIQIGGINLDADGAQVGLVLGRRNRMLGLGGPETAQPAEAEDGARGGDPRETGPALRPWQHRNVRHGGFLLPGPALTLEKRRRSCELDSIRLP